MKSLVSFHPLLAGVGAAVVSLSACGTIDRQTAAPSPVRKTRLPAFFQPVPGPGETPAGFVYRAPDHSLTVTAGEAVFSAAAPPADSAGKRSSTVRVRLAGANPRARCAGATKLPGEVHYLTGRDQEQWRTHVPTYSRVRQVGVYPGIDAIYYAAGGQLECDYVVAPGADPSRIAMDLTGEDQLPLPAALTPSGDVNVGDAPASLTLRRPVAYQTTDGGRRLIDVRFALHAAADHTSRLAFEVGDYDRTQPLVIDPVLDFSTYLGSSGYETGYHAIPDGNGNIYVTGYAGAGFPTLGSIQPLNGANDLMVAKLNASGGLVYATFIGGNDFEVGNSLAVDGQGNVCVTGSTTSTNFPLVNAFQTQLKGVNDSFLLKLNAAGSALVYSSYLGGSGGENESTDEVHLTVDHAGNAYATGSTNSADFPVTAGSLQTAFAGLHDAFVVKASPTGSLVYSTYLGGTGRDRGTGIAVDATGAAYVSVGTTSTNMPATAGALQVASAGDSDAFVAKLNPSGTALIYGTYVGGSIFDYPERIAVDLAGNAYVTGYTDSEDFPTLPGVQPIANRTEEAFVFRLNPAGSALTYSTFLGGSDSDFGFGIAVDRLGNAYVTGETDSNDFPTTQPFQPAFGGDSDVFITKINPTGSAVLYSSYLGGAGEEFAWNVEVDGSGTAYLCGVTESTNFPTVNPTQGTRAGSFDYFVSRIREPLPQSGRAVAGKKVNFGAVKVGKAKTKTLKLRNSGTTPLSGIVGLAAVAGVTVTSGGGNYTLLPKKSLTIGLRFAPTAAGTLQGSLPISTTDPAQPLIYVPLTGKSK